MFSLSREESYFWFILVVGCMFQLEVALKPKKANQISVCKDRKWSAVCHSQMKYVLIECFLFIILLLILYFKLVEYK